MTEMNSAFQETLSRRFEIVYAYRDLISNVELIVTSSAMSNGSPNMPRRWHGAPMRNWVQV